MTGKQLYDVYLRAFGWSPSSVPTWEKLEPHRRAPWEKAAAVAVGERILPTGAVRIYAAMLAAVSLAP